MSFITRQDISIRKGPLYFLAVFFIAMLVILYRIGKIHEQASWAVLIGLLVFAVVYFMLSKVKLTIDNDGITQRLFFGKQKDIQWKDVKSSTLGWQLHGHTATLEWNVYPFVGKNIKFQPSFYSRKNLQLIAEALVEKCPDGTFDKNPQHSRREIPLVYFLICLTYKRIHLPLIAA